MKISAILLAVGVLAGCSSNATSTTAEQSDLVYQQYITAQSLVPTRAIKTFKLHRWEALSEQSVLMTSRGDDYLFTLQNRCSGLDDAAAVKVNNNNIVVQFSNRPATVGNPQLVPAHCLIKAIYPLTVAQATELRNLR